MYSLAWRWEVARHIPINDGLQKLLLYIPRRPSAEWLFENPTTRKPYGDVFNSWNVARCNDPPVFAQVRLLISMIDRFVPVFSCLGLDEAGVGCKTQSSH